MKPTSPETFFSLEEFPHKELFSSATHVWDVLNTLPSFLAKLAHGKKESVVPDGVHLKNPESISIGKSCVIEPGAYIEGPCLLGDGTVVRHGAYIRGNVLTGNHCVIGHASEVKNSVLLNHAAAPHFNYVGDSILGNNTNLGAGVICANLRLDRGLIPIIISGKAFNTERKKLGLILGDRSQIGCNSVTNPGTLMGKDSFCSPCLSIGGWIPEGSIVKGQNFRIEAR